MICEACGATAGRTADGRTTLHQHHWSYLPKHSKNTIPLCASCHHKVHGGSIPEPRTGRIYSRNDVRPASDGRRRLTHVLLTDHELALIRRAALSRGLSVGAFLRTVGLAEARRALTPTTPPPEKAGEES